MNTALIPFHDHLFAKLTLESKVQIQATLALPSMDTKEWLRAQWSNPTDIFTILLIFGGEVVQVAMAQLCAGPVPYLTPVSFSFGWVSILRNHHCGLEPSTPTDSRRCHIPSQHSARPSAKTGCSQGPRSQVCSSTRGLATSGTIARGSCRAY